MGEIEKVGAVVIGSIWVVDDNPAVSESVAAALEASKLHAETIKDVSTAIERFERGEEPSALILDLAMPEGNGESLIEYIKQRPLLTFPIIIYTGFDRLRSVLRSRVYKVILKGTDPVEWINTVRRSLGLPIV